MRIQYGGSVARNAQHLSVMRFENEQLWGQSKTSCYWAHWQSGAPIVSNLPSVQTRLNSLGWRFCRMAKIVFGMNQSLDGYVDHLEMRTGPALFRHWIEHVGDLTGGGGAPPGRG